MIFRYCIVDGEDIYCCRQCKYVSEDLLRCEKVNKEFKRNRRCPPSWCFFPSIELEKIMARK